MSAWIVSRDHLDLLLTAALAWQLITPEQANETGRMLWQENLASVAYLYPSDRDRRRPGPAEFHDGDAGTYRLALYPGRVDPEVVAVAADSLACQSCEHPDWPASTACRWVTRLRGQATERIPAYVAGYGPVDPDRQGRGEHGWYVIIDKDRNRHVMSSDGWSVPDRGVFTRAAALRTTHTHPSGTNSEPSSAER